MFYSIRYSIRGLLACAVIMAVTSSAAADIHTFWKRDNCPFLNGKAPLAELLGSMEVPFHPGNPAIPVDVIGGPYCNLFDADTVPPVKARGVGNRFVGPNAVEASWACVVCQYPDRVIFIGAATPALSLSAATFVGGVLATIALIRLRKRQTEMPSG
ncbi:MAG: hypothetical protein V3R72_12065 [Gammaproteobacteria bacterium]